MKKVAIGGGQGFWGDSPDAAIHMIRNADIQYMGCDYLAELTLSIMAKQQLKDPTKGFAPDFTTRILKEAGKEAWDKHIKICTNAGGMNINGCVDGIRLIPAQNLDQVVRHLSGVEPIAPIETVGYQALLGQRVYACLLYTSPSPRDA